MAALSTAGYGLEREASTLGQRANELDKRLWHCRAALESRTLEVSADTSIWAILDGAPCGAPNWTWRHCDTGFPPQSSTRREWRCHRPLYLEERDGALRLQIESEGAPALVRPLPVALRVPGKRLPAYVSVWLHGRVLSLPVHVLGDGLGRVLLPGSSPAAWHRRASTMATYIRRTSNGRL